MADAMLTELYKRVFETKIQAEAITSESSSDLHDRLRQVALAKNKLLHELIDIRTAQIIRGE